MGLGTYFPGTDWHYWTTCDDRELAPALALTERH
jgi:hypothetical protein